MQTISTFCLAVALSTVHLTFAAGKEKGNSKVISSLISSENSPSTFIFPFDAHFAKFIVDIVNEGGTLFLFSGKEKSEISPFFIASSVAEGLNSYGVNSAHPPILPLFGDKDKSFVSAFSPDSKATSHSKSPWTGDPVTVTASFKVH